MKKFKQKKEENHTLTHTDTHTFTNELFFFLKIKKKH